MSEINDDGLVSQPTRAYGPVEDADQTRQAAHSLANDMPVDVNMNAVVARSQALTTDVLGKEFAAGSARRNILADKAVGISS